jgi:hypothetical protein
MRPSALCAERRQTRPWRTLWVLLGQPQGFQPVGKLLSRPDASKFRGHNRMPWRSTMPTRKIDTLVMIIADQNGGKSNQMRSVFEEFELHHFYGGYPASPNIARKYYVHPDMDLFLRLASWHEKGETYTDVKNDLANGYTEIRRRYKVLVPAQATASGKLISGEDLFIQLFSDFDIRRGFAVWLDPDRSNQRPFGISPKMATFMSTRRHASALAIDSLAAHPSAAPVTNSINARLLADLLFRV